MIMILSKSPKHRLQGTHRVIPPHKTKKIVLQRIKSSKLSVFKEFFRIDHLDPIGIPIYAVTHTDKFGNCRLPSWGKGITDDLSIVSGIMERVERYSASDVTGERSRDIIFSSFNEMKKNGAISRWDLVPCNLQRRFFSKEEIDSQIQAWTKCYSLSKKNMSLCQQILSISNLTGVLMISRIPPV
ncbi:MAG: hypothetical protein FJZ12_03295 [Candidatus Omnitrophica bacterium]|nr:hypothetical protein [Candidatus Omnitrophota bacterium]